MDRPQIHSGPEHLSINNSNTLKPTITKLHLNAARGILKPSCMQTKSSSVSCPSALYHSSYLHSAFPVPGRHPSYSAYPQAPKWLRRQAHSSHGNSWNHQIIAHILIICHEEFLTALLSRGSTRSKLPQLQLIQLTPKCAFDKAEWKSTWSIYKNEWIYRTQSSFNQRTKYEASDQNK